MRDTVCFDLDGTLLDPGSSIRHSIQHAVRSEALREFAQGEVLIGMPLREILRTRTDDDACIDRMVGAFRTYYLDTGWRHARWFDGMQEMVARLRDDGFQTAILTTKGEEEAAHFMERLRAAHLWDTIVGDDDVRPLKPDPAPVVAACARLDRHPRDAAMVGDTSFDVDAGRAAGAHTIGVRWGSGWHWDAAPDQADVLVDDPQQLYDAIIAWRDA